MVRSGSAVEACRCERARAHSRPPRFRAPSGCRPGRAARDAPCSPRGLTGCTKTGAPSRAAASSTGRPPASSRKRSPARAIEAHAAQAELVTPAPTSRAAVLAAERINRRQPEQAVGMRAMSAAKRSLMRARQGDRRLLARPDKRAEWRTKHFHIDMPAASIAASCASISVRSACARANAALKPRGVAVRHPRRVVVMAVEVDQPRLSATAPPILVEQTSACRPGNGRLKPAYEAD